MTPTETELRTEADCNRETLEMYEELFANDEIVPESIPGAYNDMGLQSCGLGVYYALLGDDEGAAEWFQKASSNYLKRVTKAEKYADPLPPADFWNKPNVLLNALFAAVLGDARDVEAQIVDEIDRITVGEDHEPKEADGWYNEAKAYAGLLSGDERGGLDHAARAETFSDHSEYGPFFVGVAAFVRGMIDEDENAVEAAIEMVVSHHEATVDADSTYHADLICLRASAMKRLAERDGFTVNVESEHLL